MCPGLEVSACPVSPGELTGTREFEKMPLKMSLRWGPGRGLVWRLEPNLVRDAPSKALKGQDGVSSGPATSQEAALRLTGTRRSLGAESTGFPGQGGGDEGCQLIT